MVMSSGGSFCISRRRSVWGMSRSSVGSNAAGSGHPRRRRASFRWSGVGARRSRLLGPHEAQDLALVPARDGAAGRVVLVVEDGLGRDAVPGRYADAREALIDQHLVMVGDLAIIGDAAVGDVAA